MSELKNLIQKIDELKENLNKLIEKKDFNLQDPEIIKVSQKLDEYITKFNELIHKKS